MIAAVFIASLVLVSSCFAVDNAGIPSRVFREEQSRVNVTEAIVPDGKTFVLRCPRAGVDKGTGKTDVNLLGATYVVDPTGKNAKGPTSCPNLAARQSFAKSCSKQKTCSIKAQDSSNKVGCKKRAVRVRYSCLNPRTRSVMPLNLMD